MSAKAPSFVGAMRAGQRQIGIRSQFCSTIVAEALGFSGYDYVYLDMEHSPNDLMSVLQQAQAIAATPAHTLVRIPTFDSVLIQQLLDLGIENIVVPMIENAEQAEAAVTATRYPPKGVRSMGRVHRGNIYGDEDAYAELIEQRLCLVAMVETKGALERAHEIAAVDGIHGVLVGPADLSADFGYLKAGLHPEVAGAIEAAIPRITAAGAFAGMSTGNAKDGRKWFDKGCQFVSIAGDLQLLVEQARAFAKEARA